MLHQVLRSNYVNEPNAHHLDDVKPAAVHNSKEPVQKRIFGSFSSIASKWSSTTRQSSASDFPDLVLDIPDDEQKKELEAVIAATPSSSRSTPYGTATKSELASMAYALLHPTSFDNEESDYEHSVTNFYIPPLLVSKSNPIIKGDNMMAVAIKAALYSISDPAMTYDEDGNHQQKLKCEIKGAEKTMKIKVYSAKSFNRNIWSEPYIADMFASFDDEETLRKTKAGKSGSYLVWSNYCKYVAKSLSRSEVEQAKYMLHDYSRHLVENRNSLLVRFAVVFRYKCDGVTEYIGIMKNALPREDYFCYSYDLKGSTFGRSAAPGEVVKKDLDFLEQHGARFPFFDDKQDQARKIAERIKVDVEFLARYGVVDYSLFCGFVDQDKWAGAIIDIFTHYGAKKRLERWFLGAIRDNISCTTPNKYANRFTDFIESGLSFELPSSPLRLFGGWYADYQGKLAKLKELATPELKELVPSHNAMNLATSSLDGRPSNRTVLLHEYTGQEFIFITYDHSQKGRDIEQNSRVALSFYWGDRQIRVEGPVSKVDNATNDKYFGPRSIESKLTAHAKMQSHALSDVQKYTEDMERLKKQFGSNLIPRPSHWRGYSVTPLRMEFWRARQPGQVLDDRVMFSRSSVTSEEWDVTRLYP